MTASKVTAVRYGSITNMDGLPGSEHHRRTSSMKNRHQDAHPFSTPSRLHKDHPNSSNKLNSWKYPSASGSSTTAGDASHDKEALLSSASLNRIEEMLSDSDDSFSSDSSPSRSHRTSPSLPYGPLTTPYSTQAYKPKHASSRLLRFDRATLLRLLHTSLKRWTIGDIGYGLVFFSCFCVFLAALSGIGYHAAALQTLPLPGARTYEPPTHLEERRDQLDQQSRQFHAEAVADALRKLAPEYETPEDDMHAAPELLDESHHSHIQEQEAEEDEEESPTRRRVEPLRAQQPEHSAPLVITEEPDPADEELPLWAIPKAQRQARREAAKANAAPAPTAAPKPVDERWVPADFQEVDEEPEREEGDSVDETQTAQDEEVIVVSEEDLKALQDAEDEASLDERDYPSDDGVTIDATSPDDLMDPEEQLGHIQASPDDAALDDKHAGHYHHRDGSNIFVKAPREPTGHSHRHSSDEPEEEEQPQEDDMASDVEEDDSKAEYDIVEKPDGTYVVVMQDGTEMSLEDWPQQAAYEPEDSSEGVLDSEEEESNEYRPRRAIALR